MPFAAPYAQSCRPQAVESAAWSVSTPLPATIGDDPMVTDVLRLTVKIDDEMRTDSVPAIDSPTTSAAWRKNPVVGLFVNDNDGVPADPFGPRYCVEAEMVVPPS